MDGAWRRPTDSRLCSGTPSLSEVPSGGARAFCLLLTGPAIRLFKSEPLLSGTLGGRYRSNGYVHNPTVLTVRPSSQASQLPHLDRGVSVRSASAVSPSREQAPSPQVQRHTKMCRYLCSSQASHTLDLCLPPVCFRPRCRAYPAPAPRRSGSRRHPPTESHRHSLRLHRPGTGL